MRMVLTDLLEIACVYARLTLHLRSLFGVRGVIAMFDMCGWNHYPCFPLIRLARHNLEVYLTLVRVLIIGQVYGCLPQGHHCQF